MLFRNFFRLLVLKTAKLPSLCQTLAEVGASFCQRQLREKYVTPMAAESVPVGGEWPERSRC